MECALWNIADYALRNVTRTAGWRGPLTKRKQTDRLSKARRQRGVSFVRFRDRCRFDASPKKRFGMIAGMMYSMWDMILDTDTDTVWTSTIK